MMEMTHVQLHLTGSAFALNSVLEGIIQVKKRLDPGSTNLDVLLALLALWDINSRTEEVRIMIKSPKTNILEAFN